MRILKKLLIFCCLCFCMLIHIQAQSYRFVTENTWSMNTRTSSKVLLVDVLNESKKAQPKALEISVVDAEDTSNALISFHLDKGEIEYTSYGNEETGISLMLYLKEPEWDGILVWSNPNYGSVKFIHKDAQKSLGCDLKKEDADEIYRIITKQLKKLKAVNQSK